MVSRPSVNTSMPDMRIHGSSPRTRPRCTLTSQVRRCSSAATGVRACWLPLRENLATGCWRSWLEGQMPLFDPMCGSGTPHRGRAIAVHVAPGAQRLRLEKLRNYDEAAFKQMREEVAQGVTPLAANPAVGNDRRRTPSPPRRHLQNIGGEATAAPSRSPMGRWRRCPRPSPPSGGLLLTNPPYGERLNELAELKAWYPPEGAWLRHDGRLARPFSSRLTATAQRHRLPNHQKRTPLFNGADCRLFEFELYAGTRRTDRVVGDVETHHRRSAPMQTEARRD